MNVMDPHGIFIRWYRRGRKHYGLSADEAIGYARNRLLLWSVESPEWGYERDEYNAGELVVFVYNDIGALESLGGVDVEFSISDHGNVNLDDEHPTIVNIAADLARAAMK